MKLASPPVIEVGIEFQFDPRSDKEPWDLPVARPFVERFKDIYPDVEVIQTEEIRIEKSSPSAAPKKITGKITLDRVRAHNQEGSRWIQLGNDLLVFNLVRHAGSYPGFDDLVWNR